MWKWLKEMERYAEKIEALKAELGKKEGELADEFMEELEAKAEAQS